MKRIILSIGMMIMVFIVGCVSQDNAPTNQMPIQDDSNDKGDIVEKTINIDISGFSYNPDTITIDKGTTISWTNLDSVQHTVTSDEGLFDSDLLSKDESWSYTFDEAGTFNYHCTPHPNMQGTIMVK